MKLERDTHVVTNGFVLTTEQAGRVIDDAPPPSGVDTIQLTQDTKIQAAGFCVWITHPDIAPKTEEKKMTDIVDQPPPAARPDLVPAWEQVISDYSERYNLSKLARDVSPSIDSTNAIQDVLDDMAARDAIGRERYGVPLTAYNGRDQLVDAYQEALDLSVYLRAAMEEGLQVADVYESVLDSLTKLRTLINTRKTKRS